MKKLIILLVIFISFGCEKPSDEKHSGTCVTYIKNEKGDVNFKFYRAYRYSTPDSLLISTIECLNNGHRWKDNIDTTGLH